jgi:N-acetylglutamate synthase-like GNAT family acetyltransferase
MKPEPLLHEDLLNIQSLQPADWDDITVPHEWYLSSPNCFPFKLAENGSIAGIGTIILHEDTAWLAHIIVHEKYRGRGIGTLVTRSLVEQVNQSTYQTIYLIATDLGYPVYKKLGFEVEQVYGVFTPASSSLEQGEILPNIFPLAQTDIPQVLGLDQQISGEDRHLMLDPYISHALVYKSSEQVEGAYFPTLANGLIIAENPVAGIALMRLRLQTKAFAICPLENRSAVNFLEASQFSQVKSTRRMRLGKERKWLPTGLYNRISGQVG